MDYLKNVNIKKDINPIFFHGIFFKIDNPSKSPAWSGNSKSLKKNEIRPRDFWQIDFTCSVYLRAIQLYGLLVNYQITTNQFNNTIVVGFNFF